ncbi:hypothetical protein [endosymbiont 'TC1' of Trimyema compressum]
MMKFNLDLLQILLNLKEKFTLYEIDYPGYLKSKC